MLRVMQDVMKNFVRNSPGIWTCLHTTTIRHVTVPSGGRVFLHMPIDGIDVAQLLEDEYLKSRKSQL